MNKTALMNYALSARKELESQIALSLNKLGIYEDSIKRADIVGDYTIIEGTEETFPKRVYELRNTIISDHIQPDGFKNVVEEFAYTWFNRIIALRFMEVHDYFDHGFRVLTSRDGSYEPEILKNVMYVIDDLKLNKAVVESLSTHGKTEELYRYILFNQCNKLSGVLPMLFSTQEAYMELLLPNNLLSSESVIRKIQEIPEEDFKNDIEVIGWLYQYYVACNREDYRKLKVVTKDSLPTLSQVFTPDWIVRFMVDNSIGKVLKNGNGNSIFKSDYSVPFGDSGFEEENQESDITKIHIIEPCCGSGHILVYLFDVLFEEYQKRGFDQKDIPNFILSNNLVGLDIDKRAAQLSEFALIMKARSVDPRFFTSQRFVLPKIFEIKDSKLLDYLDFHKQMTDFGFSSKAIETVSYLVSVFSNAKITGSLTKVKKMDYLYVINETNSIKADYLPNLFQTEFFTFGLQRIIDLCNLAIVLGTKYDAMITNPPYLEIGKIQEPAKSYLINSYPSSKNDLFSMFMDADFLKNSGYLAMINPDTWMSNGSFEKCRKSLLSKYDIRYLVTLGMGDFDSVFSGVMFVCQKGRHQESKGVFINLKNEVDHKASLLNIGLVSKNNVYVVAQSRFDKIDGSPLTSFDCSDSLVNVFKKQPISMFSDMKQGFATGNNDRFLRYWFEIPLSSVCFNANESDHHLSYKWFPCNKGGEFRRWYGNNYYVANWENDGCEMRNFDHSVIRNPQFYFRKGITWSSFSSNKVSLRYSPEGFLFESKGSMCFPKDNQNLLYILGFLNSAVVDRLLCVLSPTVDYHEGPMGKLPFIIDEKRKPLVENLVKECIQISKSEWDSTELSWDYKRPNIIDFCKDGILANGYESLLLSQKNRFDKLKNNQNEIDNLFIAIYGLENDVSPIDDGKYVLVSKPTRKEVCEELISYFVGVLFGRYKTNFQEEFRSQGLLSDDGLLPIYSFFGIHGGLDERVCSCIRISFGNENYKENICFVADSLGKESNESSEETINRYINESFYTRHLALFKKKPIYWLFSSGKNGAFKCLMYVFEYTDSTLARMNSKYFLSTMSLYKNEKTRLLGVQKSSINNKKTAKDNTLFVNICDCEKELTEYGQVLDHQASKYVSITFDDGISANYSKFQNVETIKDGETIRENLLFPLD